MNYQHCKKFSAKQFLYYCLVPINASAKPTRVTLATNLRLLMDAHGMSQMDLYRASKVPQRTISNMLSGKHSCSLESVNAVAGVFGLNGWHIIMPNLPADLVGSTSIAELVSAYIDASPEDRELITLVSRRATGKHPP